METTVPADVSGPAAARRFLRGDLNDVADRTREVAELLASELVSFCIRHAGEDREVAVALRVQRDGDLLRVEVHHPGRPGGGSGAGGGQTALALGVIDALAARWGVLRDGEGWSGWFEVA